MMMWNRLPLLGWSIALLLVLASPRVDAFSQMYTFGDSLSDTGNLASLIGDFPPPFDSKRVSNGPVGVEFLAASLMLSAEPSLHFSGAAQGTNYAIADARARAAGVNPINLADQVNAFLLNQGNIAPADALYCVFIGGNDVRDARDADVATADMILSQAVTAITSTIETLAGAGATTFLVTNSPDLGSVPETVLMAQANGTPELIETATLRSEDFNTRLAQELLRLQTDFGLRIAQADVFQAGNAFLRDGAAYGFDNTTEPCFSRTLTAFTLGCEEGAQVDAFFFFDEFHPTTRAHERLGGVLTAFAPSMLAPMPPAPPMP